MENLKIAEMVKYAVVNIALPLLAARFLITHNNFDDKDFTPKNKKEKSLASKLWVLKNRDACSNLSSTAAPMPQSGQQSYCAVTHFLSPKNKKEKM